MPKTKENIPQMQYAYQLWGQNTFSRKEIYQRMVRKFGTQATVSFSTLNRWISQYNKLPEGEILQDWPYQWIWLEHYGIPWQESGLADELHREYKLRTKSDPTGRHMKWLWRKWHLEGQGYRPRELPNTNDTTFFWDHIIKSVQKRVEQEKFNCIAKILNWKISCRPKYLPSDNPDSSG